MLLQTLCTLCRWNQWNLDLSAEIRSLLWCHGAMLLYLWSEVCDKDNLCSVSFKACVVSRFSTCCWCATEQKLVLLLAAWSCILELSRGCPYSFYCVVASRLWCTVCLSLPLQTQVQAVEGAMLQTSLLHAVFFLQNKFFKYLNTPLGS